MKVEPALRAGFGVEPAPGGLYPSYKVEPALRAGFWDWRQLDSRPTCGMADPGEPPEFPQRLHHVVPAWVEAGSCFHIRLRMDAASFPPLTRPEIGAGLLTAARFYHERQRWHCRLFLLMPDHIHALLNFPAETQMSRVIGEWKHYASRQWGINWQPNYFDHRIRNAPGLAEKYAYIRRNPVVKGLCQRDEDWLWVWQPDEPVTPR